MAAILLHLRLIVFRRSTVPSAAALDDYSHLSAALPVVDPASLGSEVDKT